jgi:hypothetical protein
MAVTSSASAHAVQPILRSQERWVATACPGEALGSDVLALVATGTTDTCVSTLPNRHT